MKSILNQSIETVRLKIEKMVAGTYIDNSLIPENISIDSWNEEVLHKTAVELTYLLAAGDNIEDIYEFKHPKDWWQHFRQRWFPKCILWKWPVKMNVVLVPIKISRLCPHIRIPSNDRKHIHWLLTPNLRLNMPRTESGIRSG